MENNSQLYLTATSMLKKALNNSDATFKEGQFEAINGVFTHNRSLIVQKTGWGKSMVYFISTKINRQRGKGVSIVVSPLLALIANQIEAAKMLGLTVATLSGKGEPKEVIKQKLIDDKIDVLFTTPEKLDSFLKTFISDIKIGMFIIDEAHCISDWGHDFRHSYWGIVDVLGQLKRTDFPIIGTTATANQTVINDLKHQIGPNLQVTRGPLYRDNIGIQLIDGLSTRASRYAWILDNIDNFSGTGIIYCTTQADCNDLSRFLSSNGIKAAPYHADIENSDEYLELFYKNELKVLVATIKLGMGYDKPDVGFIIHFQVPKNIVSYYQQIGRAARQIPEGMAVMLKGDDDFDILNHFIESAFPTEAEMIDVLAESKKIMRTAAPGKGITKESLVKHLNMSGGRINKALQFLEFQKCMKREKKTYYLTANKFIYQGEHYEKIRELRRKELNQMKRLFVTNDCINESILKSLDDNSIESCDMCSNCTGIEKFTNQVNANSHLKAQQFIEKSFTTFEPQKSAVRPLRLESGEIIYYAPKIGYSLSIYGYEGIGYIVKESKVNDYELPEPVLNRVDEFVKENLSDTKFTHVTYVPNKDSEMIRNFTMKLAEKMGCKFIDALTLTSKVKQTEFKNSKLKETNAKSSYQFNDNISVKGNSILLIDDVVNSGWTLAFTSSTLKKAGAKNVVPIALSNWKTKNDEEDDENE